MKNTELKIDADFPGGNIQVCRNDSHTVIIAPDPRKDNPWFYWYFRAVSFNPGIYKFKFNSAPKMTNAGVAFSCNEGKNWNWLNKTAIDWDEESFEFNFTEAGQSVRFCLDVPYMQENWKLFAQKFSGNTDFSSSFFSSRSRQGRKVEFAKICDSSQTAGENFILLTARHHSCEMTANYVLEGIIEYAMKHEDFRKVNCLLVVPFVDKDGVENGEQGKNRLPHDHGRDYTVSPLYPETMEIMSLAKKYQPRIIFDLHCPHLRDCDAEKIHFPGSSDLQIQTELDSFSTFLEKNTSSGLPFFSRDNILYGSKWHTEANYRNGQPLAFWAEKLPWQPLAASLEIPYAMVYSKIITPETARHLGLAIGKSIEEYLKSKQ